MGEVEVPADALWGAQTQRAVDNFPMSGERIGRDLIGALGSIKGAAAQVNAELGVIDADMADAISAAAAAVARGEHDEAFPVDVFQNRVRHLEQHERQRGHRYSGLARAGPEGAPERPRERVAVVQRRVPVRHPPGRRAAVRAGADPGAEAPGFGADGQGGGVRRSGQGRADAPDGRGAGDAGPGVRRVRGGGPSWGRTGRAILPRLGELPLGGTAVGTGLERAARVRRAGERPAGGRR